MTNKKMTRVDALTIAIASVDNAEAKEVLVHMVEQLSKPRANGNTKTKARLENETIAKRLHEIAPDSAFDGKYVMEHTSAMTPQKVVGIMRVGIDLGLFEKFKDGKRTVYRAL